jgi:hypothetical protein
MQGRGKLTTLLSGFGAQVEHAGDLSQLLQGERVEVATVVDQLAYTGRRHPEMCARR